MVILLKLTVIKENLSASTLVTKLVGEGVHVCIVTLFTKEPTLQPLLKKQKDAVKLGTAALTESEVEAMEAFKTSAAVGHIAWSSAWFPANLV